MIRINTKFQNNTTYKAFNRMAVCMIMIGISCLILFKNSHAYALHQERQSSSKDSLQQLTLLLHNSKADESRVSYLLKIADHYISRDEQLAQALTYLKKALDLSQKLRSAQAKYHTMMMYANYYDKRHLRSEQAQAYDEAIRIAKELGNKHFQASAWYAYYTNIPDTVMDYRNRSFYERAVTAHRLYKEIGSSFEEKYIEASLLKSMADYHLEEEQFDLAIEELMEVIALDKKYKLPDLPSAYDLLSAVYQRKGELSKALNAALLSVKIAQTNHEEVMDTYLNRVGAAYEAIGKPNESIIWYTKTLNIADKTDPYRFISAYMLTTQMIKLGKAKQALSIIKKTWDEVPNKRIHGYFMYLAFGECYTALKKYDLAKTYFDLLLSDATLSITSNPFQTSLFFSVSEFYFAQRNYNLALQFAEKARKNQISMTLPRQIRLNEILYKIDFATNRYADAVVKLQAYHKLRDSMLGQENLHTIERLQIEFQASQKENENEILRKQSELQNQELNRIQLIKNITISGLALLTILVILIYSRFRLKKKLHETLMKKKAEIDLAYAKLETNVQQKNKLIEEKESLIKEVHHRVKNNLQLTMSLLNSQSYYLQDVSAIEAIKESQHRLKSIALIHQKLYQNDNVATIAIKPYIIELIAYLKESLSDNKKITFSLDVANIELDIAKAVPLGLIINEAITNIFKYAFPDRNHGKIEISLKELQRNYQLLIKDNGIGLAPDFDYQQSNTLGLILMKGLSNQIDGIFDMESKHGVTVSLIFSAKNEGFLSIE